MVDFFGVVPLDHLDSILNLLSPEEQCDGQVPFIEVWIVGV